MLRVATSEEWNYHYDNDPHATFYQSEEWHQIVEKAIGISYVAYYIEINNKSVVVPFGKGRLKKVFTIYNSPSSGAYGGPITHHQLTSEEINILIELLHRSLGNIDITLGPFANTKQESQASVSTYIYDLRQSSEILEQKLRKARVLSKLKKCQDLSLEIITDASLLHQVYKQKLNQWSNPSNRYDLSIFEAQIISKNIDFWGVYHQQKLIGGGIFVRSKMHVSSWLPVFLAEDKHLNPYIFLYYNTLKYYQQKGYRWLDLNPSGGHKNVDTFKSRLGAMEYSLSTFFLTSKTINFFSKLKQTISLD